MATLGARIRGHACWGWDYTEPTGAPAVQDGDKLGWGGVGDTAGGVASHLPSNHTESTHKLTPAIRAGPFTQTLCDLEIGSLHCALSPLWQKNSDLNWEIWYIVWERWYIEKRCFSPFFPSHICFPVGMLPVMQLHCNVWRNILFHLMVPGISDKAFRGCFTTMGIYRTEKGNPKPGGWWMILMNMLHKCNPWGRGKKITLHQILQLQIQAED